MNLSYWLNSAWMWSCRRESAAFHRATRDVPGTQQDVLARILYRNRNSSYGSRYRFAEIGCPKDFQKQVPRVDYDGLRDAIDAITRGQMGVLTSEPVRLLEPTGGSSCAEKLIPCTDSLKKEFQRALAVWVWDVMHHLPGVRRGRAYWSISPAAQPSRKTPGGIPIGFEHDGQYLARWQRRLVERLLVVPPRIRSLRSAANAHYLTLLYLLAARDLSLISVWSPTFLSAILQGLETSAESICRDLEQGQVHWPFAGIERDSPPQVIPRSLRRSAELREILDSSMPVQDKLAACWPGLSLISCWADASSSIYFRSLQQMFPHVRFQPKGLLATEGVVSIPLLSRDDHTLAIRSHFFEFAPVSDKEEDVTTDQLVLAHELETGRHYRVFLTTGGGLYRYDLGDQIQVTGWINRCPTIRFVGRCQAVSDLVGEKLNERHVRKAIESATASMGLTVQFGLLAPLAGTPACYCLFLECEPKLADSARHQLELALDRELQQNPQYRFAVQSGQLSGVRVRPQARNSWRVYEEVRTERGQKSGDIKPVALDNWTGWAEVFESRNCSCPRRPLDANEGN
jgi:hypothetical protein